MIIHIPIEYHSPERTQDVFDLIKVLTLNREHPMSEWTDRCTPSYRGP